MEFWRSIVTVARDLQGESEMSTIAISGSFRKHLRGIQDAIKTFNRLGVRVLSPRLSEAVDLNEPFVLLETDDTDDPAVLEARHLDAIGSADALYITTLADTWV